MSDTITLANLESNKVSILTGSGEKKVTLLAENKVNLLTVFRGEKGDRGSSSPVITLSYLTSGVYDLMSTTLDPSSAKVFVNGVKQVYGTDYTIASTLLTWISSNLDLSANDKIEVYL